MTVIEMLLWILVSACAAVFIYVFVEPYVRFMYHLFRIKYMIKKMARKYKKIDPETSRQLDEVADALSDVAKSTKL